MSVWPEGLPGSTMFVLPVPPLPHAEHSLYLMFPELSLLPVLPVPPVIPVLPVLPCRLRTCPVAVFVVSVSCFVLFVVVLYF